MNHFIHSGLPSSSLHACLHLVLTMESFKRCNTWSYSLPKDFFSTLFKSYWNSCVGEIEGVWIAVIKIIKLEWLKHQPMATCFCATYWHNRSIFILITLPGYCGTTGYDCCCGMKSNLKKSMCINLVQSWLILEIITQLYYVVLLTWCQRMPSEEYSFSPVLGLNQIILSKDWIKLMMYAFEMSFHIL